MAEQRMFRDHCHIKHTREMTPRYRTFPASTAPIKFEEEGLRILSKSMPDSRVRCGLHNPKAYSFPYQESCGIFLAGVYMVSGRPESFDICGSEYYHQASSVRVLKRMCLTGVRPSFHHVLDDGFDGSSYDYLQREENRQESRPIKCFTNGHPRFVVVDRCGRP